MARILSIIRDPDCPPNQAFLLYPGAAGTMAQHPEIAEKLAEGHEVVVTTPADRRTAEEVQEAIKRVARIQL